MLSLADCVSNAVLNKLNTNRVYTINEFLKLKNTDIKLRGNHNLLELQRSTRSKCNLPLELKYHSWYDLVCHYYDKNTNNLIRVQILDIVLYEHYLFLKVKTIKGDIKIIPPISILLLNKLWKNCEIISDSDDDTPEKIDKNINNNNDMKMYLYGDCTNEFNTLPKLQLLNKYPNNFDQMTNCMTKCIKTTFTEVNSNLDFLNIINT